MFKIATCAALLLLFLWPALYNRQPLFNPDTSGYIRGFDAAVAWLSGRTTVWTTWAAQLGAGQGGHTSTVGSASSFQSRDFILAGRSVYYGALLYLGELLGGLWASVVIQAAAALAAISLTLRHLRIFSWPKLLLTVGIMCSVTALPFTASYLLPDVFAGLLLLAAANLIALSDRLSRWERFFWVSILAAAVMFHPSHLALVLLLLFASVVARLFSAQISGAGIAALAFAAGIGFVSEFAFALTVQKLLGVQIPRPPVIMARLIADGPGAAYLRENCPQAKFIVCEFANRLVSDADEFLWNESSATGIYTPASIEKRRELGNEQYRFAATVLAYDPTGVLLAWFNDGFQQLKMFGLSDFVPGHLKLPHNYAERNARSPIAREEFPISVLSSLTVLAAILSLCFVGLMFLRGRANASMKTFCLVILLGIVLNAFVCGALSGPHSRYQARVAWLIPLLALLLLYDQHRAAPPAVAASRYPSWLEESPA